MGLISDIVNEKGSIFDGKDRSEKWRQVFGRTKEDPIPKDVSNPSNSYTNSTLSSSASVQRLIQALRSRAPGGWTDDRWRQSQSFDGIQYIAIHRAGEQIGQSEFKLYRKDRNHPDGKRLVTPDDPAEGGRPVKPYDLVRLLEHPNPEDSFSDLMYSFYQQINLTGTSYEWAIPNQLGVPMQLFPIPTATAIPQPANNPEYPDGFYRIQPLYPYGPFSSFPVPNSAVGAAIDARWMIRTKYTHPLLRYEGYSPLTAMRLHIDAVEMIDRARHSSMRRMVIPWLVLNMTDMEGAQSLPQAEIDRIIAQIEDQMSGPDNAGKMLVPPPGGKLESFGQRPVDMEYQSGWEQVSSFLMAAFGITKPAAGMLEDSSYASLFATLKQLHLLTLQPACNRKAQRWTRFLCPFFGDALFIEISCPRIDDHELTLNRVDLLSRNKAITKNELRKALEFPTTTEEWGDEMTGEGEEQQQPGMPGMPGQGAPPGKDTALKQERKEARPEDAVTTASRPDTESLGEGALGPQKALRNKYRQMLNAHLNGNGHHR